jgi:hypothetical protein
VRLVLIPDVPALDIVPHVWHRASSIPEPEKTVDLPGVSFERREKRIETGDLPAGLIFRFKSPCKSLLEEILILFQPGSGVIESVIVGFLDRKRIITGIVDLAVDHHQFIIDLPWNPDFFDHTLQ